MSWAETKKINSDLSTPLDARIDAKTLRINSSTTKPLDTLIGEKTTEIKNSVSSKAIKLRDLYSSYPYATTNPYINVNTPSTTTYTAISVNGFSGMLFYPSITFWMSSYPYSGNVDCGAYRLLIIADGHTIYDSGEINSYYTKQSDINLMTAIYPFANDFKITVQCTRVAKNSADRYIRIYFNHGVLTGFA